MVLGRGAEERLGREQKNLELNLVCAEDNK
jgi:hypothetical protein